MSKAYFFAIFLLAASFTGCIGDENLDELSEQEPTSEEETTTVEDDEPITPVGTNTTAEFLNLVHSFSRPRVVFITAYLIHTIYNKSLPYIYFQEEHTLWRPQITPLNYRPRPTNGWM